MEHVPNEREGRKTARDGTQGPKKKINSQGWDPRTHERKSSAKSSCYQVGESGDRSVRAEKVSQQAEKQGFRHTEEVPRVEEKEIEKSPADDDEVISRSKKSIEVSVEGPPRR